jgi:hypothetical protein
MQHQSDETTRASSTRKAALPAKPRNRRRKDRENPEFAGAAERIISALGRRIADGNPDELLLLRALGTTIREAEAVAVAGLREQGHSDAIIANELGCTRQAVEQRWPRSAD